MQQLTLKVVLKVMTYIPTKPIPVGLLRAMSRKKLIIIAVPGRGWRGWGISLDDNSSRIQLICITLFLYN